MKKPKKPKHFVQTPKYPGGNSALSKFIEQSLIYPPEALVANIEGTVDVAYFVDGLGRIVSITIVKGLGFGCDEEVIRLIKLLVFEKAVNRGMNTKTKMNLSINFKLPGAQTTSLHYHIVPTQPTAEQTKDTNYGYTITFQ